MLDRFFRQVRHYFFEEQGPTDLGVGRFVFFAVVFLLYMMSPLHLFASVPPELWNPIAIFKYGSIPVLSESAMLVIRYAFLAGLFFSAIGLFTRVSMGVAFVTGAYLLGVSNSIVSAQHFETLMLLTMAVLAFSRAGDSFSVDRIISKSGAGNVEETTLAGEYRWPIRTIWILSTFAMSAAGFSKLRSAGLDWISSEFMSSLIVSFHYIGNRGVALSESLSLWVADHSVLVWCLAFGTIIFETFAPLAIVSRRARLIFIPGLVLMLLGIWALMGIPFPHMIVVYLFWIPWSRFIRDRSPEGHLAVA